MAQRESRRKLIEIIPALWSKLGDVCSPESVFQLDHADRRKQDVFDASGSPKIRKKLADGRALRSAAMSTLESRISPTRIYPMARGARR